MRIRIKGKRIRIWKIWQIVCKDWNMDTQERTFIDDDVALLCDVIDVFVAYLAIMEWL